MMVEVEFTKDFANKKKGNKAEYDSQLCSTLVSQEVAMITARGKKMKQAPKDAAIKRQKDVAEATKKRDKAKADAAKKAKAESLAAKKAATPTKEVD